MEILQTKEKNLILVKNMIEKYKRIKSVQHLINLINFNDYNYSIILAQGFIKKDIYIDYINETKEFYIVYPNNKTQTLSHKDFLNEKITNIGKAIELGCLYLNP